MKKTWGLAKPTLLIAAVLLAGIALPPRLLARDLTGAAGPYSTLIDINFGAHQSPGLDGIKVGLAATGLTPTDFWNFYSRDDGQGHWLINGVLPNLKSADGSVSSVGLIVSNAPGCWAAGSSDAMYNTYVYPFDGGNTTVTVTNLAAGQYDFYVYGPNGNYQLTVGSAGYGARTSFDWPIVNPPVWQEGRQYALYRGVSIGAGQTVTITVLPGACGYQSISGMQIGSATVVTGTPPSIVTQPQSQTVGVGSSVTFTVTANGTAPLTYQWRLGETNLAGATGSALVLANVQPANAGRYSVRVTNLYGSVLSSNATLTVVQGGSGSLINVNFGAHQSPGLDGVKVGLAATGLTPNDFWNFYSRDDGHGNWLVDGVLPNLKFANGTASAAGLVVSNAPGCWGNGSSDAMYNTYVYPFDSGNTTVVVTNLAVGQYDFYVYSGNGKFQLTAGGTGYGTKTSYESPVVNPPVWQEGRQYVLFRGVAVGAGQAVTLAVLPAVGGYLGISGMQISSATVVTGTPPSIVTQPQSQTVGVGSSVTFTVTAAGTPPLTYQWRLGETNLAGATGSALVLANVQPANAGRYSVRVTNLYGSVLSSNATLTVVQTTPNTLINVDFGAGPGPSAEVGAAAVGQATNDFWNFYTRDDGSGGWRTFGVLSNLKFANGAPSGAGLTVLNAPGAWSDGSSDPMYNTYIYPFGGGNATVTVTNLTAGQYNFYVYGPDGNYQLTVGATDYGVKTAVDQPVTSPPMWQEGRQYALFRGVSVGAGQAVVLTVRPGQNDYAIISGMQLSSATVVTGVPPSIVTQPQSQTVRAGSNVTFTVAAAGTPPLSYQWRLGGTNLLGATGSSLSLLGVQPAVAGNYSVRVTNAFGSVLSSNATLTVLQGAPNTLISVDFGAGPASSGSPKAGPAATGQATNDFWNFYTRDDGSGGWRTFGALSSLKFANGTVSSVGMTIANAPGAWTAGSSDPMYNSYVYSLDGGNVTITVTNLTAGQYDFYLYAGNANFRLTIGGTNYGVKAVLDSPLSNPPVWQEGRQYALFRGVSVGVGQAVTITVLPAVGGYLGISGMQIALAAPAVQPQGRAAQLKASSVPSGSRGSKTQLELLGVPNRVYVIQASTGLMAWETIGLCVTDANGNARFTDPGADRYPTRLYRVVGQ